MAQADPKQIIQTLCEYMDEGRIVKIIFSGKRKKLSGCSRVTLRPVSIKGQLMYQAEYRFDDKVTHENIPITEAADFARVLIINDFKQINMLTETEDVQILASNVDKPRITRHPAQRDPNDTSHDRRKQYVIPDGEPCDFLIKLGVMSPEGRVYKKYYPKFRQINRFLEIADDCFGYLPDEGTLRIIDFGCGKSYLTFALYHYLHLIQGRDVDISGLDLKEDVIRFCNDTAEELGYEHLHFITGDIADYESDGAHMVVTLHACDTATDFALINAVKWRSKVILSVPCCQHELFSQIDCPANEPMLKHGIIKDKFTELLTDGLRGLKLEAAGYDVNMLEFTSLEHTSKNIMIKAVMNDKINEARCRKAEEEYDSLKDFYNVDPAIDQLPIFQSTGS